LLRINDIDILPDCRKERLLEVSVSPKADRETERRGCHRGVAVNIQLRIQWPSPELSPATLARRLLTLATETQFIEIGLDTARTPRLAADQDTVTSLRRALEDAMETDRPEDHDKLAARLLGLLHSIEDEGLSLTATVGQRTVEGAAGVCRIAVLSLVIERRAATERPAAAARPMAGAC